LAQAAGEGNGQTRLFLISSEGEAHLGNNIVLADAILDLECRELLGVGREVWPLSSEDTNMRRCGVTPAAAPLDAWACVSQLL
jgi:hypothetical protein